MNKYLIHFILFFLLCLFLFSCKKNDTVSSVQYKIGDTTFGGIVFYLDASKTHGLVCASEDQSSSTIFIPFLGVNPWPFFNTMGIPGHLGTPENIYGDSTIGGGLQNSNIIVSTFGSIGNAAALCRNYFGGGFNDWYLPNAVELNEMCLQKGAIKIASTGVYWSSSAVGYSNFPYIVFVQNFSNNSQTGSSYQFNPENGTDWNSPGYIPSKYKVRAVRKF